MKPITVVKLGGSLLERTDLRTVALEAIARTWRDSESVVVVHGGGKRIDAMLSSLGIPKLSAGGLRVTDQPTLEVVTACLGGVVNKSLVAELHRLGVSAAGITGADGETIVAVKHDAIDGVDLGHVGRVIAVHPELVRTLLAIGVLPLVGSLGIGPDGQLFNVNADSAASALATALGASRLIFLTDVEGLQNESGKLVEQLDLRSAVSMLDSPAVTGGMRPKLHAVIEAIRGGLPEVVIAGPARHSSVLIDGKGGTHLVAA